MKPKKPSTLITATYAKKQEALQTKLKKATDAQLTITKQMVELFGTYVGATAATSRGPNHWRNADSVYEKIGNTVAEFRKAEADAADQKREILHIQWQQFCLALLANGQKPVKLPTFYEFSSQLL